ncbi:UPF0280 family protein [Candidatus Contubernalis alkaliaceticus]|uniref:UPF0280 family protein n=1 Tax=Candidatus Contubernalis alkaliaceticus TaxID=338645 RepID=UPI001F4C3030|nr:UPF0280 family protein [Candidatus Contubernalis alkalaceticus]UNC90752.1 UPF0280 family protein [Candidatus Contubernalis alkalaceticus]
MSYDIRSYRNINHKGDLSSFQITVKETDLFVLVDSGSFNGDLIHRVESTLWHHRQELESFIDREKDFKTSLVPYLISAQAPAIALMMARAANTAGVGPMASVAGAFAEVVGRELMPHVQEVIVENGGDLFLKVKKKRKISVLCGSHSPFSCRLALEIKPGDTPMGVCTSSGVIGPSLSLGRADAVVVVSPSVPLADAAATALANQVKEEEDIEKTIEKAKEITGVKGVLIIKGDKLGLWGKIKIVSPKSNGTMT